MNILDILLLAVGLAMDCFSVSVAAGLSAHTPRKAPLATMALLFGLFQALMPVAGWLLASQFAAYIEQFDHWIAFGLLLYLGGNMARDSFKNEQPTIDTGSIRTLLTLSVATSIDALAVGISFACIGMDTFGNILLPVAIIGAVSFVLSCVGTAIGMAMGKHIDLHAGLLGGIILIVIGTKILIEHLT